MLKGSSQKDDNMKLCFLYVDLGRKRLSPGNSAYWCLGLQTVQSIKVYWQAVKANFVLAVKLNSLITRVENSDRHRPWMSIL